MASQDLTRLRLPVWVRAALFGLAYFFSAELGQLLTFHSSPAATFWPPSGLYVAILLLDAPRTWPAYLLAAFSANIAFDLQQGRPLWVSLLFCCGNSLEAAVRDSSGLRFRPRPRKLT